MADRLTDEELREQAHRAEPDFWPEDRWLRLMATELVERRAHDAAPVPAAAQFVLDYDSRDPGGPMFVGPFDSIEAAEAWHVEQRLDGAEFSVRPLTNPKEADCG